MAWNSHSLDKPYKPDKGLVGGACNRQACQAPGAIFYNHGTDKYYCGDCAITLNTDRFNAQDSQRLYGHDLVQLDEAALEELVNSYKLGEDGMLDDPDLEMVWAIHTAVKVGKTYQKLGKILTKKQR